MYYWPGRVWLATSRLPGDQNVANLFYSVLPLYLSPIQSKIRFDAFSVLPTLSAGSGKKFGQWKKVWNFRANKYETFTAKHLKQLFKMTNSEEFVRKTVLVCIGYHIFRKIGPFPTLLKKNSVKIRLQISPAAHIFSRPLLNSAAEYSASL